MNRITVSPEAYKSLDEKISEREDNKPPSLGDIKISQNEHLPDNIVMLWAYGGSMVFLNLDTGEMIATTHK